MLLDGEATRRGGGGGAEKTLEAEKLQGGRGHMDED